jgi:immune inhibitor A
VNRSLRISLRWLLLTGLLAAFLLTARSDSRMVVPDGLHFMPPHPESSEESITEVFAMSELDKIERGIDVPEYIPNPPSGDFNLLVVLVDFGNKSHILPPADFDNLFFNTFNFDSVADYYSEISFGSLALKPVDLPSDFGWQQTPNDYDFYVNYDFGWGSYPNNLQGIVDHIISNMDDVIDFSQYDNDGDGFVDGVVFVHAGKPAELTLRPNDIWSATWDMSSGSGPGPIPVDGVFVDNFSFGPEYLDDSGKITIGVFTHELGHMLFGLPDLYDLGQSSYGVGNWSLMSYGAWNGEGTICPELLPCISNGDSPAWPDAWSRIRMGFESPQVITQNITGFEFFPVESNSGNVVKLWTPNLANEEYFLVEYRQITGYDKELPGEGLLIWHVDETKWNRWELNLTECEVSPCCGCEEDHPMLALIQADSDLHLETNANKGDSYDPFKPLVKSSFKFGTNPESGSYYASDCPEDSCIALENIATGFGLISADLKVICQTQGACVNILTERLLGWGEAGEAAVYEASIQNCGNASDFLTLSHEGGWDVQFVDLHSGELIPAGMQVPAGGSWEVGIMVTSPPDALWGSADTLSLTVTSAIDENISATASLTTNVPYCTLVVDDDRDAPNVRGAYIDSLTGAGFDFDVWDTQVMGSPDEAILATYKAVLWFTGTPNRDTLTPHDEAGLMSYLDGGGSFFLSSQEFLTDTLRDYFGRNYLRVGTFVDNAGTESVTGVTGNPLSAELGPYTMSAATPYSDRMNPFSTALSAFKDDAGKTNAITHDTGTWRSVFLGWPLENLAQTDGEELMASTLDWMGVPPRPQASFELSVDTVCEGETITFNNTSSNASAFLWSFGDGTISTQADALHVYADSLTATVVLTGTNSCGYDTAASTITVYDSPQVEFTPSTDTIYVYQPVTFSLLDPETDILLSYLWDFDDGTALSRETNPTHIFSESGWYTVTLATSDGRCTGITSMMINVKQLIYLPLMLKK